MRTRPLTVGRGLAAAAALSVAGWGAMALPAAAYPDRSGDPAGNNGTVKVTETGPCEVQIEWYGFDEGADIVSTVDFNMQAPTEDVVVTGTEPSQVFVGEDPASGAGTDSGFDGAASYVFGFEGEPDPEQGYHVKVTVHTKGSQGADTKHKVFWVQGPCDSGPGTPL